ncbi:hypothetical protein ACET3Z_024295 [Daucus carota]
MAGNSKSHAVNKPGFTLFCYPLSHINKPHCEIGNKIIMPASALDVLLSRKVKYPLTFMITNPFLEKVSHCGVLEFSAEEGSVFLPEWMMRNLSLEQGQLVEIEYTGLSKGRFLKVQPHSSEFVKNLENPKEVMERLLRDFACLTIGDTIMVNHENQEYYIDIVEAMPKDAVSLFETDCELEFEKPLDYHEEPQVIETRDEQADQDVMEAEKDVVFRPFSGVSRRLDGRVTAAAPDSKKHVGTSVICGSDGECSAAKKKPETKEDNEEKKFQAFTGKKYSLLS